jgi:BirA family biotin operon repressor/biotin-[acetyl-CoA-carboxylase] ligase
MATFIFASELPLTGLSGYSLVVGVAVARLLHRFGVPVKLKWPNDVVVLSNESYGAKGGAAFRKLAGILVEVEEFNGYRCILVGIGLNLAPPPEEVRGIATSVAELKGQELSVSQILEPLGGELLGWHESFVSAGGFKVAADLWSSYSCFIPNLTKLRVDLGDGVGVVSGVYQGMGAGGSLLVATERGVVREVVSGHIVEVSGVG